MTLSAMTDSISITLNGDPRSIAAGSSVADLVREIGLDPPRLRSKEISKSCRALRFPASPY